MKKDPRTPAISLAILISIFVHITLFTAAAAPDYSIKKTADEIRRSMLQDRGISRDIIANINQDDLREITQKTLLSDRDSRAEGYITRERGDRWLNNSLDFKLLKGDDGKSGRAAGEDSPDVLHSKYSDFTVYLEREIKASQQRGMGGESSKIKIPDRHDVTRENAIFYSNKGTFSFNTAEFKHYHYFKNMKEKIASNWYPPMMANAVLRGYAPGETRIQAIRDHEVKLYFTMNRAGDVLDVEILSSHRVAPLDESCVEAIKNSENFGRVPDEIEGEIIVIPFIFGYYSR